MQILDDLIDREPSPWMTIEEAADYWKVTPHTIHVWCRAGKLTKHRVGGFQTIRLKREEVESLARPA